MEEIPTLFITNRERWDGSFSEWLREENWDILEITDQECARLTIDKNPAFLYTGNPRVMQECKERGIDVIQILGEEMRKGMGGIHCMICPTLRV